MSHLVIGAGVIGGRVAQLLAERGERVSVVSRSGAGPANVTRVAADARDAEAMTRLAEGAGVIYNCVNPPYHRWPTDWPPIAASVLSAAESSGAVLVTLSNLYGYGPRAGGYDPAHPMTEQTPLAATGPKGRVRARVWQDALAAHRAGRVRATEVRAADFVGPGAESTLASAASGGSGRARASRCSAAPTGCIPGRSLRTWPACWWWPGTTRRRGDAPGMFRRMSRAPSARPFRIWPRQRGPGRSGSARSRRPPWPGWGWSGPSCGS